MCEVEHRLPENLIRELEELLKSFNQIPKDKFEKTPDNKFPVADDDSIELRRKPSIQRNRFSKTTDFDFRRRRPCSPKNEKNFEIRGLVKFQLPNEKIITKLNQDYITYEDENFYRINGKTNAKDLLKRNVVLKSARYLNKNKEVELKDSANLAYILYFDSVKYAKQFMENDKVQTYVSNDSKTTIKKTLLRFLGKRSSREILERKGIYKNEPIFGNTLRDIYVKSGSEVPTFIYRAIELIERSENIKSLGLYRTSGNLAIIQKIRFEVDNGRLGILDRFAKDPDVLTGSLKLFFRELKEPLIPLEVSDKLLEMTKLDQAKMTSKDLHKIRCILVDHLHEANVLTLSVLINHLLEVVKYKEDNKMDVYNLAVCWGPSMVFSGGSSLTIESSKDIVLQSQDATRLVDFLLVFYMKHPTELTSLIRKTGSLELKSVLRRQESKDSFSSTDSSVKGSKKSASCSSLSVDEAVKKAVDIIECSLDTEGLYRRPGVLDKSNKILKKFSKKKINELDKYKHDVYDVAEALKKYLKDSSEALVTREAVEQVLAIIDENQHGCMELATRRRITSALEDTPRKDTLIYVLKHLSKVIDHEHQHRVSKNELLNIWTKVLNPQGRAHKSEEAFSRFLGVSIEALSDNLPDVVRLSLNSSGGTSPHRSDNMAELFRDLKNRQEKDRHSRYDNVDSDTVGEASILDEKTERTKL